MNGHTSQILQSYGDDKLVLKTSSHGIVQIIDRSDNDLWIASRGNDVGVVMAKHVDIIFQTTEKPRTEELKDTEFQTVTAGVFTPNKDTVIHVDVRVSPEVKFRSESGKSNSPVLDKFHSWLKARQGRTCLDIHKLISGPVTRVSMFQGHVNGYDVYYSSPSDAPDNLSHGSSALIGHGRLGRIKDKCEEFPDPPIIGNVVIIYYSDLIRCKAAHVTGSLCKIIKDLNLNNISLP